MCKIDLLSDVNGEIYQAIFEAAQCMAVGEIEFNMAWIGPIADEIEHQLQTHGIKTCYPWENEDEILCCNCEERCEYCHEC